MPFELHTTIEGTNTLYFDKAVVRKALRREGSAVARLARWYVSGPAGSEPGEAPGTDTGALGRAIKAKVARSGFATAIAPYRTPELMRKGFYYPAALLFGATRRKQGGRLDPRENYVMDAVQEREAKMIPALQRALYDALS